MSLCNQLWYSRRFPFRCLAYVLSPLSWGYRVAVLWRRVCYRWGLKKTTHFPVPIIVVGNITVGGTGKTPLVISMANWFIQQGWRPGVVSRGYRGRLVRSPQIVTQQSQPSDVGDEAVLIAQKTQAPVCVCIDRVAAVRQLLKHYACNMIISDDGLQHFALGRDVEIVVLDGVRRVGNGFCLPAGPLREPVHRLKTVDFCVTNGEADLNEWGMRLVPETLRAVKKSSQVAGVPVEGDTVHAVAGIGNPARFFKSLTSLGFHVIEHVFPDHYFFQPDDLAFNDEYSIIMTEKDAVKCSAFAQDNWWCLPVHAELSLDFLNALGLPFL